MKKFWKCEYMPCLMLLLGGGTLGLRELLYRVAIDERGLMAVNHPLELAVLALSALALLIAAGTALPRKGTEEYAANFPASPIAAGGSLLMALGILLTVFLWGPEMGGALGTVWTVLGIVSGMGLIWVGLCRWKGTRPGFGFHAVLCLFFAIHMVSHYQTWSQAACVQDYLFPLLGGVALVLFSYYQTAFDVDLGNRRMALFLGLAGIFLCTAALTSCGYWLLYGSGIAWAWTNLPFWQVPPAPSKEEGDAQ